MLLGRAAFLLLFSLCRLEPVHDGGLRTLFGRFGISGLLFHLTVVDDPGNHGEEESKVRCSGGYQIGLEQSLEHAGRSNAHEDAKVGAAVC